MSTLNIEKASKPVLLTGKFSQEMQGQNNQIDMIQFS